MFALLAMCAGPPGLPNLGPVPGPSPVAWSSGAARRMRLVSQSTSVDAEGKARWIVSVRFETEQGKPTRLLQGGDVEFSASRGDVQWQTRSWFGASSVIVRTTLDGPIAIRASTGSLGEIPDARLETNTSAWKTPRVVAQALGPHAVQIGWFPAVHDAFSVVRSGPGGTRTVCDVRAGASTCRDATVQPGATYQYFVDRRSRGAHLTVNVPPEPASQSLDAIRGKGMWLQFSPDPVDFNAYNRLDAAGFVRRAKAAGIRYIELRLAYGEFWEVTPAAKRYVDALIDAASDAGIAVIGWTVPRAVTFDDLARSAAAANYQTPRGARVAGLAVDLEKGDTYMGDGPSAAVAMEAYMQRLREALGPNYLILATVQDPYFGNLTNGSFPYAGIARYATALQPMAYWRMFQEAFGARATAAAMRQSLATLQREAGRAIPINLGGQTLGQGSCGAPTPAEIVASLDGSRAAGAIGETFFDWFGTADSQWTAIGSFSW